MKCRVRTIYAVVLLMFVFNAFADTLSDTLVYRDKESVIEEAPLDDILVRENLSDLFRSNTDCTDTDRCYSAKWKIVDRVLYLVDVRKDGHMNVPLARLLPDDDASFKAVWFSGNITAHTGYQSIVTEKECTLVLEIADGVLMREYYDCS